MVRLMWLSRSLHTLTQLILRLYRHIFIMTSAVILVTIPVVSSAEIDFLEQQKITSHLIINMFLLNIDEGKLELFGEVLKRDQLDAHQVYYIYNLEDDDLEIGIYLKLKKPLVIPHFEDFSINGVSVDIDKDGNIKEIKSHASQAN